MPRQHQRGPVADLQVLRRHAHALCGDVFHLAAEALHIQRNAVSQNIDHIGPEDTGGEQVQGKFPVFVDDGVPRVSAALITHHNIIVLREQIDHTAFPLIAPVNAYNGTSFHKMTS